MIRCNTPPARVHEHLRRDGRTSCYAIGCRRVGTPALRVPRSARTERGVRARVSDAMRSVDVFTPHTTLHLASMARRTERRAGGGSVVAGRRKIAESDIRA